MTDTDTFLIYIEVFARFVKEKNLKKKLKIGEDLNLIAQGYIPIKYLWKQEKKTSDKKK